MKNACKFRYRRWMAILLTLFLLTGTFGIAWGEGTPSEDTALENLISGAVENTSPENISTNAAENITPKNIPSENNSTGAVEDIFPENNSTSAAENTSSENNSICSAEDIPLESTEANAPEIIPLGEGEKAFCFSVISLEGEQQSFDIRTDCETVGGALQELGLISGEAGPFGLYVKEVLGIPLSYDKDGHYWAFYVGDEYAMTGVDTTPITEGAKYAFRAE